MAVTTTDVLTQEEVRMRLEEITQESLQFRSAFRDLDLTGIDSDTYKVPRRKDVLGEPDAIPEGTEFPMDEEEWEKIPIHFQKYGFSVPISMEAQQDSMRNVAADHVDAMGRQMNEMLNRIAYEELSTNLNDDSPAGSASSGTSGVFDYHDVIDAQKVLRQDSYSPDMLVVNTQAEADLLTSDEFIHASDLGDETLTEGAIGQVAGMDVVVSNDGHMSSSTGEGYLVDTSFYGYEATRSGIQTDEYYEDSRQIDVMQIYTQRGFKAIDEQSAVLVEA